MRLSRESHYGLLALVHLANAKAGTVLQAAELARQLQLSPSFLAKVVQKLAAAGILHSYRGRVRGYALAGPASAVSARAVIEAIDPEVFTNCVFSSDRCSELRPCLLHPVWKTVRAAGGRTSCERLGGRPCARPPVEHPAAEARAGPGPMI